FEYARTVCAGDIPAVGTLLSRLVTRQSGVSRTDGTGSDGFQRAVARFIQSRGVWPERIEEQGAFNFYFVIEDPRRGLFGIGIECDAPRHPLLKSARARELWRPAVLRQSIPVVHRVSSYGWYHQPNQERSRLEDALRAAITEGAK